MFFFRKFFYSFIIFTLILIPICLYLTQDRIFLKFEERPFSKFFRDEEEKLFYVNGNVENSSNYYDEDIPQVNFECLGLKRETFIYQIVESKKKNDYVYSKKWVKNYIKSENFNNKLFLKVNNFKNYFYNDFVKIPNYFEIDNYVLSTKNKVLPFKVVNLNNYFSHETIFNAKEIKTDADKNSFEDNNFDLDNLISSNEKYIPSYLDKFKITKEGFLYNGNNIENPEIGDIKIVYSIIDKNIPISFVGAMDDNKLIPLKHKNTDISIVKYKNVSKHNIQMEVVFDDIIATTISCFVLFVSLIISGLLLKYKLGGFLLKIPFFGEYFYFNSDLKMCLVSFLTVMVIYSFLIAIHLPVYSIFSFIFFSLILKKLINIDYYSI